MEGPIVFDVIEHALFADKSEVSKSGLEISKETHVTGLKSLEGRLTVRVQCPDEFSVMGLGDAHLNVFRATRADPDVHANRRNGEMVK